MAKRCVFQVGDVLLCVQLRLFRLIESAIDDSEGAEACSGIGERSVRLGGGKQDGGEEQGEARYAGGPIVPEAERENYKRSASNGEQYAEGEPAAAIAA